MLSGGTTHPFLTLQFLTDGRYDPVTALFLTPRGHEKHLVATDHLEAEDLRGLMPSDLFDIVARHRLHFDHSRQVGIVFHMISCLTEHGRIGLTAVGDSAKEAERRYREAQRIVLDGLEARWRSSRCRGDAVVRGSAPLALITSRPGTVRQRIDHSSRLG
jgi:hypothetical protein